MKKAPIIVIGIVIVVVIGGLVYAKMHMSGSASTGKAATASTSVLTTKTDSAGLKYLAGPSGMALYTYGADTTGASNCTGACLSNWPAYVVSGSATNLPAGVGTFKRSDTGQTQYTYNGMPLYYFVSDNSGQVSGDGMDNFKVAVSADAATPAPVASQSPAASATPMSTPTQSGSNSYNGYSN